MDTNILVALNLYLAPTKDCNLRTNHADKKDAIFIRRPNIAALKNIKNFIHLHVIKSNRLNI